MAEAHEIGERVTETWIRHCGLASEPGEYCSGRAQYERMCQAQRAAETRAGVLKDMGAGSGQATVPPFPFPTTAPSSTAGAHVSE